MQRERLIHLIKSRSVWRPPVQVLKARGRKRIAEVLPPTSPTIHHHISAETRERVDIIQYLDDNEDNPALKVSSGTIFIIGLLINLQP